MEINVFEQSLLRQTTIATKHCSIVKVILRRQEKTKQKQKVRVPSPYSIDGNSNAVLGSFQPYYMQT